MLSQPNVSMVLTMDGDIRLFHSLLRSLVRQTASLADVQVVAVRSSEGAPFPAGLLRWSAILPCREFLLLDTPAEGSTGLANAGAARAEGRHLLFLMPGHRLLPNYLETCLTALENGADAAYSDRMLSDGRVLRRHNLPDFNPRVLQTGNPLGRAVLLKRALFEACGGLGPRTRFGFWELWIRAAQNGFTLARTRQPLLVASTPGQTPDVSGRHEALVVVRNHAFFPDLVLRWALALLRGESWALPMGPGRTPNERQVRLLLENAALRRETQPVRPAAESLPWDRFLPEQSASA
ncbi:MAG TPA: hypothetical protein DD766_09115 [Desulfovibrio sp.]|nr:hypothetical protein [Desulfovibrio sp.]